MEDNLECNICGKGFTIQQDMKRHVLTVHKKCIDCSVTFQNTYDILNHLKECNNNTSIKQSKNEISIPAEGTSSDSEVATQQSSQTVFKTESFKSLNSDNDKAAEMDIQTEIPSIGTENDSESSTSINNLADTQENVVTTMSNESFIISTMQNDIQLDKSMSLVTSNLKQTEIDWRKNEKIGSSILPNNNDSTNLQILSLKNQQSKNVFLQNKAFAPSAKTQLVNSSRFIPPRKPVPIQQKDKVLSFQKNNQMQQGNFFKSSQGMLPQNIKWSSAGTNQNQMYNTQIQPKTYLPQHGLQQGSVVKTFSSAQNQNRLNYYQDKMKLNNWKCHMCSGFFLTPVKLRNHLAEIHYRVFFCQYCFFKFPGQMYLENHTKTCSLNPAATTKSRIQQHVAKPNLVPKGSRGKAPYTYSQRPPVTNQNVIPLKTVLNSGYPNYNAALKMPGAKHAPLPPFQKFQPNKITTSIGSKLKPPSRKPDQQKVTTQNNPAFKSDHIFNNNNLSITAVNKNSSNTNNDDDQPLDLSIKTKSIETSFNLSTKNTIPDLAQSLGPKLAKLTDNKPYQMPNENLNELIASRNVRWSALKEYVANNPSM